MKVLKLKIWFVAILIFLVGCSRDYLIFENTPSTPPEIVLTSATIEDLHPLKMLIEDKVSRSGLPAEDNLGNWFYEHHLRRVEEKDPYHLYVVRTKCGDHLGYIQLGVMPTLGYNPNCHREILDKWVSLGVLQKVFNPENPCECNAFRIDNRGLAFILPILRDDLTICEEERAIDAIYGLLQSLRCQGKLLPYEKTYPHQVITLLKPSNNLIESFVGEGFLFDDNEGFFKFYHKDRVMLSKCLE